MSWENRESIPFPFLSGMVIAQNGKFYRINGQGIKNVLSKTYTLIAGQTTVGNTFTTGNVSTFTTDKLHMKQWVTWIDNVYLQVVWSIDGNTVNLINGNDSPLTYDTSPEYSEVMPLALVNSPQPQVAFKLINNNPAIPIFGNLKIILWEYAVVEITDAGLIASIKQNGKYTDLSIRGGGTVQGGVA